MFYAEARPRAPIAEFDQGLVWTAVLLVGLGLLLSRH